MMEIEKPRITCEETDNGCFARFVVEPLDRGFGITLGNCLRRVLSKNLNLTVLITILLSRASTNQSGLVMRRMLSLAQKNLIDIDS